mmetsp:Transcript_4443/g.16764  ORF Transcript_4443/g.16764 Transcript_4443/m.16764 type:complete len:1463 (-) Transcript_4443:2572-6960(-)
MSSPPTKRGHSLSDVSTMQHQDTRLSPHKHARTEGSLQNPLQHEHILDDGTLGTTRKSSTFSRVSSFLSGFSQQHFPNKQDERTPESSSFRSAAPEGSPSSPASATSLLNTNFASRIQQALSFSKTPTKSPSLYQKNILTLTFKNWELEKKFLHNSLYGKKLWRFKLFLLGAILVNALFIFVDIFQVSQSNVGTWPYYTNISLRVVGILFGISHYVFIWIPRGVFWTEYFTAVPLFVVLACTMVQSVLTTNFVNNRFPVGAVLIIIATYMLPRLRSIVYYPITVGASCCFIFPMALVHGIPLVSQPLPLPRIIVFCIIIILSQIIAFVLNYMNEYYLRYVFILSEDLQHETHSLRGEKERSQALLENILPAHLTHKVKSDNSRFIHMYADISVLFSDLVQFTAFSSTVTAEELIAILNKQFSVFDQLCKQHHLEKIKSVGDAIFVLGGSNGTSSEHSVDCIGLGLAMIEALNDMNMKYGWNFEIRVGVACGNGLLSVLGKGKLTFDVFGDAVKQSEKMEESSLPGRVHVSGAIYRRSTKYFSFEPHPHQMDMDSYLVVRKKMAYNNRVFRPVEVEEIAFHAETMQGRSGVGQPSVGVPDFLSVNTGVFLETAGARTEDMSEVEYGDAQSNNHDDNHDEDTATTTTMSASYLGQAAPTSVNDILARYESAQRANTLASSKRATQKRGAHIQKVLCVELQRFFLTEDDYAANENESLKASEFGGRGTPPTKHSPHTHSPLNMKLNRFTLTFDWPTTFAFYKEAYSVRQTNLKIMFFLIFFFNLALCACMLITFPEHVISVTFILWYVVLLVTFLATMLYLMPFVSRFTYSGALVCTWFVLSNSLYVYFIYILPQKTWEQLIGIVSCWAILSLNIFPTIPFLVKVALNVPLCVIVILVDFIFVLVHKNVNLNPFLYISLVVQTVIQLFGSYIADFTQANVFILRNRQKMEKKNIVREQQQNNMVIESVLPPSIAERLRTSANGSAGTVDRPFVSEFIKSGSILFAEFSGFESGTVIDPVVAVGILNDLFSLFDMVTVKNQTFKVKSIGATYLILAGLNNDSFHALHLANTAIEIRSQARKVLTHYKKKVLFRDVDVGIKIGCHSGSFSCGVVGETRYLFDCFGDTCNISSRLKSTCELDKIQCSTQFYESTKNSFVLYPRGEVFLKGKGITTTYWLVRSNEHQSDQLVQTEITGGMMDTILVHGQAKQLEMSEYLAKAVDREVAELQLLHAERMEGYRTELKRLKKKLKRGTGDGDVTEKSLKKKLRSKTSGEEDNRANVVNDKSGDSTLTKDKRRASNSTPQSHITSPPTGPTRKNTVQVQLDAIGSDWNSMHVSEGEDQFIMNNHLSKRQASIPKLALGSIDSSSPLDNYDPYAGFAQSARPSIGGDPANASQRSYLFPAPIRTYERHSTSRKRGTSPFRRNDKTPQTARTPRSKTPTKKSTKKKKSGRNSRGATHARGASTR